MLLASFSLGGLMFAQTPATPPAQTAPVSQGLQTTEIKVIDSPCLFTIGADFRTRSELDNGQFTFKAAGSEPENTVFSRARLNFEYKKDKLTLKFSPQLVRVWGQTDSQGNYTAPVSPTNTAGATATMDQFNIYEAWAQYAVTPTWAMKVGKMPLSYDDERLFGALDWAMQGRSFDAAKLIYTKNKAKFELAGVYNNDIIETTDVNGKEVYSVKDGGGELSKSIQILHYQNEFGSKVKFAFIAVNNTVQVAADGSHNSLQTFGINPRLKLTEKLSLFGSAYYQGGRNSADKTKKAFQFSGNLELKPTAKLTTVLGAEILSGTSYDDPADENNSFSPMYGTNHKFNGYMDYFYVGNHFNTSTGNPGSRGLNDFYLKSTYKATAKGTLAANFHAFMLNKELSAVIDEKFLGTEVDLVYTHKVADNFNYQLGYSQMMGNQDTMKALKGIADPRANQSWAWVQLNFSPKLFSAEIK